MPTPTTVVTSAGTRIASAKLRTRRPWMVAPPSQTRRRAAPARPGARGIRHGLGIGVSSSRDVRRFAGGEVLELAQAGALAEAGARASTERITSTARGTAAPTAGVRPSTNDSMSSTSMATMWIRRGSGTPLCRPSAHHRREADRVGRRAGVGAERLERKRQHGARARVHRSAPRRRRSPDPSRPARPAGRSRRGRCASRTNSPGFGIRDSGFGRSSASSCVGDRPADAVVAEDVVPEAQDQHLRLDVSPFDRIEDRVLSAARPPEPRVPSPESRSPRSSPCHTPNLVFRSTTCTTSPRALRIVAVSGISPGSECVAQPKQGS